MNINEFSAVCLIIVACPFNTGFIFGGGRIYKAAGKQSVLEVSVLEKMGEYKDLRHIDKSQL